jgi:hypothetical protein
MFCYKHGAPAELKLTALPHRGIVFIGNSHLNCIPAPAEPREIISNLFAKKIVLLYRKNEAPMEPDYFGNA